MCGLILILLIIQFNSKCFCLIFPEDESFSMAKCYARDLRISELLRLKLSLDKISLEDKTCESSASCVSNKTESKILETNMEYKENLNPSALALTAERRGYDSEAHVLDYHPNGVYEEKPSKLQTLFQITITALAFLSFGGYLLCLIVQAIKSKGTTYFHPVATATTTTNGAVKRIKIYRRSRRYAAGNDNYKEPADLNLQYAGNNYEEYDINDNFVSDLPSPAELSKALLKFSEEYVKVHNKVKTK